MVVASALLSPLNGKRLFRRSRPHRLYPCPYDDTRRSLHHYTAPRAFGIPDEPLVDARRINRVEPNVTAREVERATDALIVRYLFPVWLGAGLLDWYWHRQTQIERTAGAPESIMHLLMGLEAGCAFTFALFCETTKTSVAAAFAAALVHELTTIWDVAYTVPRREIKPREHHTHSFLEVLPFCIAAAMAVRPQAGAQGLKLRAQRPSLGTIVTVYGAAAAFGFVPHLEELARCLRSAP